MATINKILVNDVNYDIISDLAETKILELTERIDSIESNNDSNSNASNIIVDDRNVLLIGTGITPDNLIAYFGEESSGISLSKKYNTGECDISIEKNPWYFLNIGSDSSCTRIGIGDNTKISNNVSIGSYVSIGKNTKIEDSITIGSCINKLTNKYDTSVKIYQHGEGIIIPRGLEIGEDDDFLIIKTKRNTYKIQPS